VVDVRLAGTVARFTSLPVGRIVRVAGEGCVGRPVKAFNVVLMAADALLVADVILLRCVSEKTDGEGRFLHGLSVYHGGDGKGGE